MNIAVYAGAADGLNPNYKREATLLGEWMARNDHALVYGAGKVGMMGYVAEAVHRNGGKVIGVIPEFLYEKYQAFYGVDELIVTKDMSDRKKVMCDRSDAALALPGGSGTIEEITEAISWSRLEVKRKPCILFNTEGFYDLLYQFYQKMVDDAFFEAEAMKEILLSNDFAAIERFIKNFQ